MIGANKCFFVDLRNTHTYVQGKTNKLISNNNNKNMDNIYKTICRLQASGQN